MNVKKSIQYAVQGFELTTFRMWVSSRNHKTSGQSYKASTLINYNSRVISISNLPVIMTIES